MPYIPQSSLQQGHPILELSTISMEENTTLANKLVMFMINHLRYESMTQPTGRDPQSTFLKMQALYG